MNIAIDRPSSTLLQMVVETLPNHQVAAWMVALPDCRVVAESKEAAIVALEARLETRMRAIEVIDFPGLAGKPMEHPVMKFAGIFKDDPDFAEIVAQMRAERELDDDNPAYT